jgi:hypothetical protein
MVGLRNIKRMNEKSDVYKEEVISFIKEMQRKNPGDFYILADDAFIVNAFPLQNILPHHDIASLWYTRNVYDYHRLKAAIDEGKILLYVGEGYKLTSFDVELENSFSFVKKIQGFKVYQNIHAHINH